MLSVAVLTTQTLHHAFFVNELSRCAKVELAVVETAVTAPVFAVAHPFETLRDNHEREVLFGGEERLVSSMVPELRVVSINDTEAAEALSGLNPDLVFVFGTSHIKAPLIELCRGRLFNLHGGDPRQYRGLDSHLWAIYHRDFRALVTTLHEVELRLDTGAIVYQQALDVTQGLRLFELRAANTRVCVELARRSIAQHSATGRIVMQPIKDPGRYYSFMPAVLKDICVLNFEKYTKNLSG